MDSVNRVNPMIGAVAYAEGTTDAHGFGKTFPGAVTPFGLVQLSPDTITGGDNGSGYSYEHTTLEGFSFTHMSGVGWYGDLGNFLMTPTVGELKTARGTPDAPEDGYRSRFSHDTEVAEAGYYAVTLADYGIRAELSAAPRSGILRFAFPEHAQSRIQIDLSRRVGGTSTEQLVKVVDEHTICGWMKCPPEGGGWGNGGGKADYTVHFCCRFSKPLKRHGVWHADIPTDWARKNPDVASDAYQSVVAAADVTYGVREAQGPHLGFFSEFATTAGEVVTVKCGISFVSIEGARANLEHDIPHWDFDAVRTGARATWAHALSSVHVEGGTDDDRIKFYTALYHSMIDPRSVSDVNGDYIGADGRVHRAADFTYRTIFSGWDVFRSQFPLQTLVNPGMVNDEINSLLQLAELSGRGYLPRWEILNSYSGCMLGNPGVSVIVDAYEKGIRNYDIDKAFVYCKSSVDTFTNGELGYSPNGKGCISETLEYAYSDWCFARFAESLGRNDLADEYDNRSQAYRNLWNDEIRWFRSKDEDGNWLEWQGKTVHGQGCRESNPYQQGWFVPHDVPGLIDLMGHDYFLQELVALFENTPEDFRWNDYYNHPNEPVHNIAFLFNEIGAPWLTQKWTRTICANAYGADAFGLCGNEDVGQMSAWYVLAAMGVHPICPGDGKYQITSPVFERIEIALNPQYYPGKTFTIAATNNSETNLYIQSMKLNGKALDRFWITHQEIAAGGMLEMEMGPEPGQVKRRQP
ncbi:MAG: glycoside hydrolase family 92 protein [Lentisphaerae bacterium]|jgi:predicted alpha-1,2-mannosidase|nr:glycoside hydrolase family 92 protein [Lentisphaerota bacterium]MBT5604334.1 glycoside hydrolase family 92 protein [Lentisphaerota bacterium]MBT7055077.1 glycoside hydrolase family 92 protein [Lentisphaerota bacterium]MBT7847322.1 glycoside hydrolase family 92 protein [Lentisphaerota bacterium]